MTNSQRILVNTTAQYIRTIINVCLLLYSTRLILSALGQSDYGIYSVVAGVVAMLSFITNAFVTTTQRYLSFHQGTEDKKKIYQVFGNSILLHIAIGIALMVILGSLNRVVIYEWLNIDESRLSAASSVYVAAVLMLMISFLTAPFRALFIARENIVYISVIDIIDGLLKVLSAILLIYITFDKLAAYALFMIGISVFNFFAFVIYASIHYEECHWPKKSEWDKTYMKDLSSFAGWTIYSTGCVLARTQGIAIILNRLFGSIINAAYGIALQVSGAVYFVAQSVLNAMSPQIMKAEGSNNRKRMIYLSEAASKYATLTMAMVIIPLVFEMPTILELWLSNPPEYTVMFCRFILIASLCDQITTGLSTANQAIGKIRNYSIIVNTIKVFTLPAVWLCLQIGLPVNSVMWCYLIFELICALTRVPFLQKTAGLDIREFTKEVLVRLIAPIVGMIATCWAVVNYCNVPYRFLLTFFMAIVVGLILVWCTALNKDEKNIFNEIILSKLRKR